MSHDVTRALSVLGIAGQALAAVLLVAGLGAAAGARGPLDAVRRLLWGYELWLAFAVSAIATGGSLFFSEIAHYVPCELCWFQRICMYPLSIVTLLAALANDHRVARYLLPLPVVGGGVSIYHLLVEHGVITETQACRISAPGGCATKWIDEFGYVTIPALALTGFALAFAFLVLASASTAVVADAEAAAIAAPPREDGAAVPGSHTRIRAIVVAAAVALAVGAGIGWTIGHYAGRSTASTATTQPDTALTAGRRVFAGAACGSCHMLAAAGSTGTVGPNLDELGPDQGLVLEVVTNGKGVMPSFRDRLSAGEIQAVAAYVAAATR